MTIYAANTGGWLWIGEAPNARTALRDAKSVASSASLLPSDVTYVLPATPEQLDWYKAMGGKP